MSLEPHDVARESRRAAQHPQSAAAAPKAAEGRRPLARGLFLRHPALIAIKDQVEQHILT
jgi:hypothetical protein